MQDPNTVLGGPGGTFPKTRWTLIREAGDPEKPAFRTSMHEFARLYWKPVYAHFRRKWNKSNEDAKDLTQEFFEAFLDKQFLQHVTAKEGKFRSYVMAALDNFVRMKHRDQGRIKRGGGAAVMSLDIDAGYEPQTTAEPDQAFLREWAATVLSEALDTLEKEYASAGQEVAFQLLVLRDVDPPKDADLSYEGLAKRFKLKSTDVTNHLYRARQRLRELVMKHVRDTTTTEEEAEQELRDLFGGGG